MSNNPGPSDPLAGLSNEQLEDFAYLVRGVEQPETRLQILRHLVNLLPPRRHKLPQYNKIEDAIGLIEKSSKILVLTGAGVSTSAGLPDFRSRQGIYVQIHEAFPDLQDPKSMFDINYFRQNPKPFYQFAKALYPGQFSPTIGHRFIKLLEDQQKLLRNYTQNIDTLEKQAGITRVVECHGSFAKASCTSCNYTLPGEAIREDIFNEKVPLCPICSMLPDGPNDDLGIMKPNIVFFGEQLGEEFHKSIEVDKNEADLLIVIGSSLKVKPVAMIPRIVPSNIPQILINKEPLDHMDFDIELLGDCDDIIQQLCLRLGGVWKDICQPNISQLTQLTGSSHLSRATILPPETFVHIEPHVYLFPGVEMSDYQWRNYTQMPNEDEPSD